MPFIKEVALKPVINGFLIKYEYLDKETDDDHSSIRFINDVKETFTTPEDAMARAIELSKAKNNLDFYTPTGELKQDVIKAATK